MKTFFDGIFISKEHLDEAGVKYPIKLEYYKTKQNENRDNIGENEKIYGIEIVKTEYKNGNVVVETKELNNLTNKAEEQENILELLKNNEVTPIGVDDVLEDLLKI